MIERLKLWWPVIKLIIDGLFYLAVGISVFVSLIRHEWAEATAWGVLYCMGQLRDIGEKL